jgi:cytidyltransferase-like protein
MTVVVYLDGVFDLFHRGHLEAIRKAKHLRPEVYLIVGLCCDADVVDYKRRPFTSEDDRYQILSSIKDIDQVVFPGPLVVTPAFLARHKIDLVVHGFANTEDAAKQTTFVEHIRDHFEVLPYYTPVSTSKLIADIRSRTTDG